MNRAVWGNAFFDLTLKGLATGGAPEDENMLEPLTNSGVVEKAVARWTRERIAASQPLAFTLIEETSVTIPGVMRPEQCLINASQPPEHWELTGVWTPDTTHQAVMVVGTFSNDMSMDDALAWAEAQTEHGPLMGSGARGRKGWHDIRPVYAGEKERHFPGRDSRWKHRFGLPGDCGPSMWHDGGRMGPFGMNWVGSKMSAGHLFHFLRKPN